MDGSSTVLLAVIEVVTSDAEFAALAAEPGRRCRAGARVTSVFETFDWQYLWWRHYGAGRPLRLLLARSAGALVGILPLFIDTVTIASPVRLLRLVGTGGDTSPDDLGPVLAAGREGEVAGALADAVLALPAGTCLLISDLQPENAFRAALAGARGGGGARHAAGALRAHRLSGAAGELRGLAAVAAPRSPLPRPSHPQEARRPRTRRASSSGTIRPRWPRGSTRWCACTSSGGGGRSDSFSSPQYLAFHGALMAACLERDRLRLYCLEISGAIAAMFYFYRFRGRVYLMQSGFDPDFATWKPGQVLLGHVVEHAIGEKHEVLDFLRGDHRYKDELATGVRETVFCDVFRPTLGAYLYRTGGSICPR